MIPSTPPACYDHEEASSEIRQLLSQERKLQKIKERDADLEKGLLIVKKKKKTKTDKQKRG